MIGLIPQRFFFDKGYAAIAVIARAKTVPTTVTKTETEKEFKNCCEVITYFNVFVKKFFSYFPYLPYFPCG